MVWKIQKISKIPKCNMPSNLMWFKRTQVCHSNVIQAAFNTIRLLIHLRSLPTWDRVPPWLTTLRDFQTLCNDYDITKSEKGKKGTGILRKSTGTVQSIWPLILLMVSSTMKSCGELFPENCLQIPHMEMPSTTVMRWLVVQRLFSSFYKLHLIRMQGWSKWLLK